MKTSFETRVSLMGSGSFVDINIFVLKYYFIWFFHILHFIVFYKSKSSQMLKPSNFGLREHVGQHQNFRCKEYCDILRTRASQKSPELKTWYCYETLFRKLGFMNVVRHFCRYQYLCKTYYLYGQSNILFLFLFLIVNLHNYTYPKKKTLEFL